MYIIENCTDFKFSSRISYILTFGLFLNKKINIFQSRYFFNEWNQIVYTVVRLMLRFCFDYHYFQRKIVPLFNYKNLAIRSHEKRGTVNKMLILSWKPCIQMTSTFNTGHI